MNANTAPPDWATQSTDITCPLCSYNLRGLAEPRCPECGYAFAWTDLLDGKRDRHPWLFEHAGRQPPRRWRNARAFVVTYVRSGLPWRLWRDVSPVNPIHVGRLLAYWFIAAVPLLSAFAIAPVRLAIDTAHGDAAERAMFTPAVGQPGRVNVPRTLLSNPFSFSDRLYVLMSGKGNIAKTISTGQLDALVPSPWSIGFLQQVWEVYANADTVDTGHAIAIVLAWPWMSVVALLLFQASMRRAKIGWRHVLRVAIYSCDFGLLIAVGAVVIYGLPLGPNGELSNVLPRGPFTYQIQPVLLATIACCVLTIYRLSVGCLRYLGIDRPARAVLASQAIVLLAVFVVLLRTTRMF